MKGSNFKKKFHIKGKVSTYKKCVEGLLSKKYDVISTDDVILAGLAYEHGDKLVRAPQKFTEEKYGMGMRKNDPALKYLTCLAIKKAISSKKWEEFHDKNLKTIMDLGKKQETKTNKPEEPTCKGR